MGRRGKSVLRKEDEALSTRITEYLDESFYHEVGKEFERVNDRERQVKGVDVIFDIGDKHYVADEKAAVRYRNLKTFSLELSFVNKRGEVQDGWLISDKMENNSYVLIWVDEQDGKESVTIALVMKEKILRYLRDLGWTKDNLERKMSLIRNGESEYMGNIYRDGCKFSFSEQLVEKPINVLLSRDAYLQMADVVWSGKIGNDNYLY